ncbi:MAG: hypothetical protein RL514_3585 [Verrucomicrobiota bacterium]|jgi:hypothetical protein
MEEPGHIYVLINPSIDGLVKIGKTTRSPEERAEELSAATGVATPFYVAYSIQVADCHHAEEFVHAILDHNGFRRSPNREFFQIPLQKAIEVLLLAQQHLQQTVSRIAPVATDVSEAGGETSTQKALQVAEHPGRAVFEEAINIFFGKGDEIQDEREGVKLLEQAKVLNFPAAFTSLAEYYAGINDGKFRFMEWNGVELVKYEASSLDGSRQRADLFELALTILKEGARRGHGRCYIKMAWLYVAKEDENVRKSWKKYFQSPTFANDDDRRWTGNQHNMGGVVGLDMLLDSGHTRVNHALFYLRLFCDRTKPLDAEIFRMLSPLKDELIEQLSENIQLNQDELATMSDDEDEHGKEMITDAQLLVFIKSAL